MKSNKIGIAFFALTLMVPLAYFGWMQFQKHRLEKLSERARVYWDARMANDLVTAYHLEAAAASGNMLPDEVEKNRYNAIRIIQVDLGSPRLVEDGGEVDIVVTTNVPFGASLMPGPKHPDHWTLIKGEWFHGYAQRGGSGLEKDPAPGALKSSPSFMKGKP